MKSLNRWGDGILGEKAKTALELVFEESVISKVELFERRCIMDGQIVMAGCIGGVWTNPNFRRMGHAAVLIQQALVYFDKNKGFDIALLFSLQNTLDYYRSRGWELITGPVVMQQPGGSRPVPDHVATLIKHFTVEYQGGLLEIEGLPW